MHVAAQGPSEAYLFYNADNNETCTQVNADGSNAVVDTFFKMENKGSITFFICGERFFYKKTQVKNEIFPIQKIDMLKLIPIEEAVKLWKDTKKSKQEVFDKIYIIQKNSPDTVVFYPVNWM
jgi:hypothetical protein